MKTLLKISLAMMIASSSLLAAQKWATPSKETCIKNGGSFDNEVCSGNLMNANKICQSINATLANIDMFHIELENCGGKIADKTSNKKNLAYQSCYKDKGFSPAYYWSSTSNTTNSSIAFVFYGGTDFILDNKNSALIRCVELE